MIYYRTLLLKNTTCLPQELNDIHCLNDWFSPSPGTTDYLHTQGFIIDSIANFVLLTSTVGSFITPLPLPGGNGFVAVGDLGTDNKEYISACLDLPLKKDVSYTLKFSIGFMDTFKFINILEDTFRVSSTRAPMGIYGHPDCDGIAFEEGCPLYNDTTDWVELGRFTETGKSEWKQVSITFVPNQDYTAIAIGPDCGYNAYSSTASSIFIWLYFLIDDLSLTSIVNASIEGAKIDCNEYKIEVENRKDLEVQWYLNGIALLGENENVLLSNNSAPGSYQAMLSDGSSCSVSNKYEIHPVVSLTEANRPELKYIDGDTLRIRKGVAYSLNLDVNSTDYSLWWTPSDFLSCSNCINPTLTATEDLTYTIEIWDNETDCFSEISLYVETECNILIPNAFTPNNDGINDQLRIFPNSNCIETVESFMVYNRWGEIVYKTNGSTSMIKWDGNFKGKPLPVGVYIYALFVKQVNGIQKSYRGDIGLIR